MVLPGLALNDEGNPNDERMIPPGFARYLDLIGFGASTLVRHCSRSGSVVAVPDRIDAAHWLFARLFFDHLRN
jgi:hypothetical protein